MEMDRYSILLVYIDAKRSMLPMQKAALGLLFLISLPAVVLPIVYVQYPSKSMVPCPFTPSYGLCSGFWTSHCLSLYQGHNFAQTETKLNDKLGTRLNAFKDSTDTILLCF